MLRRCSLPQTRKKTHLGLRAQGGHTNTGVFVPNDSNLGQISGTIIPKRKGQTETTGSDILQVERKVTAPRLAAPRLANLTLRFAEKNSAYEECEVPDVPGSPKEDGAGRMETNDNLENPDKDRMVKSRGPEGPGVTNDTITNFADAHGHLLRGTRSRRQSFTMQTLKDPESTALPLQPVVTAAPKQTLTQSPTKLVTEEPLEEARRGELSDRSRLNYQPDQEDLDEAKAQKTASECGCSIM